MRIRTALSRCIDAALQRAVYGAEALVKKLLLLLLRGLLSGLLLGSSLLSSFLLLGHSPSS